MLQRHVGLFERFLREPGGRERGSFGGLDRVLYNLFHGDGSRGGSSRPRRRSRPERATAPRTVRRTLRHFVSAIRARHDRSTRPPHVGRELGISGPAVNERFAHRNRAKAHRRAAAARGSRTPDLLITNQLLFLLSYSGICAPASPMRQSPGDMNRPQGRPSNPRKRTAGLKRSNPFPRHPATSFRSKFRYLPQWLRWPLPYEWSRRLGGRKRPAADGRRKPRSAS